MTSAAQVHANRPKRYYDSDNEFIDPSDRHDIKQAVKRCLSILKTSKEWVSDAQLRREAELDDYCTRNWTSILGELGENIEIRHGARTHYRYCEPRVLPQRQYNNNDLLNPPKAWSLK